MIYAKTKITCIALSLQPHRFLTPTPQHNYFHIEQHDHDYTRLKAAIVISLLLLYTFGLNSTPDRYNLDCLAPLRLLVTNSFTINMSSDVAALEAEVKEFKLQVHLIPFLVSIIDFNVAILTRTA